MSPHPDFPLVFEKLRSILQPFAARLSVKSDTANTYYFKGPLSRKWKKELFFGSAQIKKNHASFYLMPVYMYPGLLKGTSPELKKHMQGKACFNFRKFKPILFEELISLTQQSLDRFQKEEYS